MKTPVFRAIYCELFLPFITDFWGLYKIFTYADTLLYSIITKETCYGVYTDTVYYEIPKVKGN